MEQTPGRYALHDLLRAYADELGRDDGERPAAVRRVLDHYLRTALAADALLWPHRDPLAPPDQADSVTPEVFTDREAALAWFGAEHAALLAGMDQAAGAGLDGHVWRLAWALANFFARRGHWSDWVRAGLAGVAAARRQGDRAAEAEANRIVGGAHVRLRRYDEAQEHYRRALELFDGLGDLVGQGFTYRSLGWLSEQQGDVAGALRHDEHALGLFQRAGHVRGEANTLNSVGWCLALLGDHERAIVHCRRSLALLEPIGDPVGMAGAWDSLGYAYRHVDLHQASACYREALLLYRKLGDRMNEAVTLRHLGETQHAGGDPDAARRSWRQSLDILTDIAHPDASGFGRCCTAVREPARRRCTRPLAIGCTVVAVGGAVTAPPPRGCRSPPRASSGTDPVKLLWFRPSPRRRRRRRRPSWRRSTRACRPSTCCGATRTAAGTAWRAGGCVTPGCSRRSGAAPGR
ncbi:tetratricopeptide repeat protein [Micromonospora sp. 4G55]|nr:tetratricopeptide repeat protein [Micromonospora sp. 4G55]